MEQPIDSLTPEEVEFHSERKERVEAAEGDVSSPSVPVTVGSN